MFASGGIQVVICKVLTVSAGFVHTWLNDTAAAKNLLPGQPTVWVRPFVRVHPWQMGRS